LQYAPTEQETPRFGKIFDVIVQRVISPKASHIDGRTAAEADRASELSVHGGIRDMGHATHARSNILSQF